MEGIIGITNEKDKLLFCGRLETKFLKHLTCLSLYFYLFTANLSAK